MCQIIYVPEDKEIDFTKLDKAQKHNEDGYGVLWYESGQICEFRTMDYEEFKTLLSLIDKECQKLIHMRYTTKGSTDIANNHPFKVHNGYMMHNGTITGFGSYGKHGKSDTQEFASMLNTCTYDTITNLKPIVLNIIGSHSNKLAFMEDDGDVILFNSHLGLWEDGIWYSNDYHKKADTWARCGYKPTTPTVKETGKTDEGIIYEIIDDEDDDWVKHLYDKYDVDDYDFSELGDSFTPCLHEWTDGTTTLDVFVYGTLKRGYGNHRLLEKALYLGKAKATKKWAMTGEGKSFPYVLGRHDILGNHIEGEVYRVTYEEFLKLETLEGYPFHYDREVIDVEYLDTGVTTKAAVYVKTTTTALDYRETMLTNWSR